MAQEFEKKVCSAPRRYIVHVWEVVCV